MKKLFTLTKEEFIERSMNGEVFIHDVKGNKMELCEMIKVMQHFRDGGEVEFKMKNITSAVWAVTIRPKWEWDNFDYQIKEPKQKVTIEKWLFRDKQGDFLVIEISNADNYKQYEKVKLIESYEVEL